MSKFPLIQRDLALIVKHEVNAAEITKVVTNTAGSLLVNVNIFDVYRVKVYIEGHKSIAVTLILQDNQRTLVDEEINKVMNG